MTEDRQPRDDHQTELSFQFAQPSIHNDGNELFYSNLSPSFGELVNSIRKSSRSLRNRLQSIKLDSEFVESVAEAYQLPMVANSRAGDWYIDPQKRAGTVYFKSTDGHTGQWKFSLRRLNLGLLEIVGKASGAIIVDSTRRGKRFPDSLAKTIPIWISVLNKVCFPEWDCDFYINTLAVSPSEASQIEQRIDGFVQQFLLLGLDINPIKMLLSKPLRPIWVTPDSPLPSSPPEFTDFVPLILVTASRMTKGEGIEGEYIQGAGDDHEGWAAESGLSPVIFWENHELLLKANEDGLLDLVHSLVRSSVTSDDPVGVALVKPTETVYIGSLASAKAHGNDYEVIVNCSTESFKSSEMGRIVDFPVPPGKRGAKVLRNNLRNIIGLLDKVIGRKIFFACPSGNDMAPVVALAVLCLYYNDEGEYRRLGDRSVINKSYIRKRLAWISSSKPEANPSRSALNAVNSFLIDRPT